MRIYGWDDIGVARGEMERMDGADARMVEADGAMIEAPGDWVAAYASFAEAKRAFVAAMLAEGVDDDMVREARRMRAHDLPWRW